MLADEHTHLEGRKTQRQMNLSQPSCALLPGLMAWASWHSAWPVPMGNRSLLSFSPRSQLYELTWRSSAPPYLPLTEGKGRRTVNPT